MTPSTALTKMRLKDKLLRRSVSMDLQRRVKDGMISATPVGKSLGAVGVAYLDGGSSDNLTTVRFWLLTVLILYGIVLLHMPSFRMH